MFELSLHVLDIVENSLRAEADSITITVEESVQEDLLEITISDDGEGMSSDLLQNATDPFTSTKNVRKQNIGLGLPLFKQIASACDGDFRLDSKEGRGTVCRASFRRSHPDRPPLGDMAGTIQSVLAGHPDLNLAYLHRTDEEEYRFHTAELRAALGELPLDTPSVLNYVRKEIEENLTEIRPEEYIGEPRSALGSPGEEGGGSE